MSSFLQWASPQPSLQARGHPWVNGGGSRRVGAVAHGHRHVTTGQIRGGGVHVEGGWYDHRGRGLGSSCRGAGVELVVRHHCSEVTVDCIASRVGMRIITGQATGPVTAIGEEHVLRGGGATTGLPVTSPSSPRRIQLKGGGRSRVKGSI